MKILFDCLGFSSASIFVEHDGRQLHIGSRRECPQDIWINDGIWQYYIKREELPSKEQIELEYKRILKEKGVWVNNKIQYAG